MTESGLATESGPLSRGGAAGIQRDATADLRLGAFLAGRDPGQPV
jgi:hypothetical protein